MLVLVLALAAALSVYHLLPARAQRCWLLLLSYAFYAALAPRFLPVLAAMTLATWVIARRLADLPSAADAATRRRRRGWLMLGVAIDVGALGALRWVYGSGAPFQAPFAVLGLSFYSLQALSYLFDTYSGALRVPHTFADFALYLSYFPKVAAGPIERPGDFLRQLAGARVVDDRRLARAATLIAVGLTRKLVIADPLAAQLPAGAFTAPADFGSLVLAATTVGWAFVLYNDFAGYTGIARGLSCLFGIELARNFAQPFAAGSFTELWNRWHITFSHWLRDYVYLPLSRHLLRRNLQRGNAANLLLPPIATMLVCGLWHGASAHMLLWGGLHGVYLVLERALRLLRPSPPGSAAPPWPHAAGIALVFGLSCWTFIALRLPIEQAIEFWRQLAFGPLGALPDGRALLFVVPSLWLDRMEARHGDDALLDAWPRAARAAALAAAALLWFAATGMTAPAPFVYQGF